MSEQGARREKKDTVAFERPGATVTARRAATFFTNEGGTRALYGARARVLRLHALDFSGGAGVTPHG